MWGGVIDGGGCSCGAGMDVWGTDASMGQGWICGAEMHLWGSNLWGRDASVGQGWICGAGIYGVGLYVGQGWICEARMHLWGRNPSVGQESMGQGWIYGAESQPLRPAPLNFRSFQCHFRPSRGLFGNYFRPFLARSPLTPPTSFTSALNSTHFLHIRP